MEADSRIRLSKNPLVQYHRCFTFAHFMQATKPTIHLLVHSTEIFDYNSYTIESIIALPHLKSFEYASLDDYINSVVTHKQAYFFALKPMKASAYMEQLQQLSVANGKGEDFIAAEWIRYLQKAFATIAQKNKIVIYIKIANGTNKTINKPFTLQSNMVNVKFALTKKDAIYGVDISYQLQNEWIPAKEGIRQEFMLYHQKDIYILSYTDTVLLNWLEKHLKLRKQKNYDTFNEQVLHKIEVKHNVDRTAVFAPISIESDIVCKVHIKETLGTYIIIEPMVYYNNFSFSDIQNNKNIESTLVSKGSTYSIKRQVEKEKEFYRYIESFHENFKKQMNGYFQLNFGEAGKKQWFYKFFLALHEKEIDLIGVDLLQHFRYSTDKPVTTIRVVKETETKITIAFILQYDKEIVPLAHLQKALRNQQHSFPLKDNSIAVLPPEWLQQYATIVKHGVIAESYLVVSKSFVVAQQLQSQPSEKLAVEQALVTDEWKNNWMLWQQEKNKILFKPNLQATLRDYQQKGMEWLYLLSQIGAGALLADDMGLGKTLQTIAYIEYYNKLHPNAKHLVLAPASLLYNWQNEIDKFAPNTTVAVHYGVQRNWDIIKEAQVVVTSYSIGRNDMEQLQSVFWNTIILDESHYIKNPDALTTKAVTMLEAGFKICLSGTPVMNNTMDLYAQFNFLLPDFFYSRSFFKQEYAIPIDDGKDEEKLVILQKITNPYILRRTKQQVATELPPKVESVIWCTLGQGQRALYESIKTQNWNDLQTSIAKDGMQKNRMQILTTLLRLRQTCDSPLLLPEELQTTNESAKLDIIIDEIKNNTGSSKVVVFSQFVKMMDLLKIAFEDNAITYQSFDGSTNARDRADLVDQFQNKEDDTKVFLISLKAGAVGITLTEAEYVYIVDPWWNKAIENQAIDRIHRIGQTKHIFAYKMICKDTIEERIVQLQQRKTHLSESLIQIEEDFVKQLSEEDLEFLFS
jgi:SNF2 family DNA or RNA helicase